MSHAQEIGGRRVVAMVCTHAHDNHVNRAPALSDRFNAPVLEAPLWNRTARPTASSPAATYCASRIELRVLLNARTPPARPASTPPNWAPSSPAITLSQGGPRRHGGRSYSSFDTINRVDPRHPAHPVRRHTTIRTGNGDSTTIGTEAAHLKDWLARRHDVMLD
jgi:hypothetical protein